MVLLYLFLIKKTTLLSNELIKFSLSNFEFFVLSDFIALYQNQAEFGIFILSVPLKMPADRDGFLNQMAVIVREIGARSFT